MSSILSSQGVVVATAMAVSGAVILLALRLQKSIPTIQFPVSQIPKSSKRVIRSCISSDGGKREKIKKNKRVHFAEDVVDPSGQGEEFRRQHSVNLISSSSVSASSSMKLKQSREGKYKGIPANRVALYNGILRDRVVHRVAYSY